MGYLYFVLATALILLVILALIFFERVKERPNPRLNQKPKRPQNKEQRPGTDPAVRETSLGGEKYIPSYQSNPDALKHIERFLSGATTRGDNSIADKQSDNNENGAVEFSLGDKGRKRLEKDEKEAVNAQEPVQLELDMEHTRDKHLAVNE